MQVAATKTPIDMRSILDTWSDVAAHGFIRPAAVPILAALVAVENAHGASVYNHNWGNITTSDETRSYFLFPENARKFLSFGSHGEGASALLARLKSPTHARMLDAANRGDVAAFVRGMTTPHPDTGMMYCDTCAPGPTLRTYEKVVRSFGGTVRPAKSRGGSGLGLAFSIASAIGVLALAKFGVKL